MSSFPQIGQTLRLSKSDLEQEKNKDIYKSRISDMQGDVAAIELPINEKTGRNGSFETGAECDFWYIGDDGSRYDFRASVLGRRSDNIPVLLIQLPRKENVKRTQRRNYLRVNMQVEIAVKVEDSLRNYHFLTRTNDLSGGGLSFSCAEEYRLKEHDKVNIWITMPSKTGTISHANALGEVTRCTPPEVPGKDQWISVKFLQVNESDQSKIVRACYERQLESRKKGIRK